MRRLIVALGLFLAFTVAAQCTAFTSTQSGNWNNAATWGGGGFPNSSGDTATIAAQNQITCPVSVTCTVGAITYQAGSSGTFTNVIINGTLELNGTMGLAANSEIDCGPDAVFDLNGNNVTTSGATKYNFAGTSGHRCIIQSTGSAGQFQQSGSYTVISTWSYVAVSGLGDSVFGRGNSQASALQSYSFVSFTNCAVIYLEFTSSGANSGILVSHVDFRDPSVANPLAGNTYQPFIDFGGTALGSQPRTIEFSTWSISNPSATRVGIFFIRGPGFSFNGNVLADYQTQFLDVTNTLTYSNNYQGMYVSEIPFAVSGSTPMNISGSYFYVSTDLNHPFSPPNTLNLTVTGSVFEPFPQVMGTGLKWFLAGAGINSTWTLHNNVFLGYGSAMDFARTIGDPAMTPTVLHYNNTHFVDQLGALEGTPFASFMRVDHPGGVLTGTQVEFYNNMDIKPNAATSQNISVSLQNVDANQVTYAGYNVGFAETSTTYSPPILYTTGCPNSGCSVPYTPSITITNDQTAHDFSVNPQFVDRTRNIAGWAASLGLANTEAAATACMLKMNGTGGTPNAGCTPTAAVTWVRAGFVPNNVAIHNTGRNADDIGAMPWAPSQATGGIVQ